MKKYIKIVAVFVGFIFVLGSCRTASEINLMQERAPYYGKSKFEDYRLQVNDEIYCTILTTNTEFAALFNGVISSSGGQNNAYIIYDNGNISIPFFGDINILGKTIPEAEVEIQQVMKGSVPDAQVLVGLKNNLYYIVSNGSQNGSFMVHKDNMTIFQALAISGKPDELIDYSKVKIIRQSVDGRSVQKEFDLRTSSIIESEFYYIKPNDVIYYSKSGSKSFFNISSFTGFINKILLPINFMASSILIYKIK